MGENSHVRMEEVSLRPVPCWFRALSKCAQCVCGRRSSARTVRAARHGWVGEGTAESTSLADAAYLLVDRMHLLTTPLSHSSAPEASPLSTDDGGASTELVALSPELPSSNILAELAVAVQGQVAAPARSGEKVACIAVHSRRAPSRGNLVECCSIEAGTRAESAAPASACDAETCALAGPLAMAGACVPGLFPTPLKALVLAADTSVPPRLSPGGCELLAQHLHGGKCGGHSDDDEISGQQNGLGLELPVLSAWRGRWRGGAGAKSTGRRILRVRSDPFSKVYPHPNVYRSASNGGSDLASIAKDFAAKCESVPDESGHIRRLFDTLHGISVESVEAKDRQRIAEDSPPEFTCVGPCYSAGVICESGGICWASCFAGSVDVVARLSVRLEDSCRSGETPAWLLICDQWGVLHAPSAVGRSYLVERGFGNLSLLVHEEATGALQRLQCRDLLPWEDREGTPKQFPQAPSSNPNTQQDGEP
eukprot:TRINITY_DN68950_c0_g1_i1.p1 TRINITY_DN68950_c0_g1~~TRINITY_DN68950_c0_g1_i1.p1  ORF type:complete len:480 (+),score=56.56 TRINITY_DN68950_c0_g1_i1:80-1519(+)